MESGRRVWISNGLDFEETTMCCVPLWLANICILWNVVDFRGRVWLVLWLWLLCFGATGSHI